MGDDAIAAYLRELERALARAGRPPQPLVDEAAAHLHEDAARIAAAEGCGDAEAARRAVARFGAVGDVIHSVRDNAPMYAARIARVATVLLVSLLGWLMVDMLRDTRLGGWPIISENLELFFWLPLVGELALVSRALWRALRGGDVPRWLPTALRLNGAVAFALFTAESLLAMRFAPSWIHVSIYHLLALVPPLWLLMCVQSVAGLRALSIRASLYRWYGGC